MELANYQLFVPETDYKAQEEEEGLAYMDGTTGAAKYHFLFPRLSFALLARRCSETKVARTSSCMKQSNTKMEINY